MINNYDHLCPELSSFRKNLEALIKTNDYSSIGKLDDFVEEYLIKTFTFQDLPFLFDEIISADFKRQHLGLICMKKLLPEKKSLLVQMVIDRNLIPSLIDDLVKDDFPQLQIESALVLTKMFHVGTFEQALVFDMESILPLMIKLLNSSNSEVLESVIYF